MSDQVIGSLGVDGGQVPLDLEAIRARALAAHPGSLEVVTYAGQPMQVHLQAYRRMLVSGMGDTDDDANDLVVYFVEAVEAGKSIGTICITGNGPTSAAGAEFFAHARADVLAMAARLEALEALFHYLGSGLRPLGAGQGVLGAIFRLFEEARSQGDSLHDAFKSLKQDLASYQFEGGDVDE